MLHLSIILHTKYLYWIHKQHHTGDMSSIGALDAHPVEHLFGTPSDEGSFQFSIQQASLDSNDPNEAIRSAVNDNPRAHTEWLHSSGVYGN